MLDTFVCLNKINRNFSRYLLNFYLSLLKKAKTKTKFLKLAFKLKDKHLQIKVLLKIYYTAYKLSFLLYNPINLE